MHKTNYTLFHLLRYHIELIEALEYSLMTYKLDKDEVHQRLKFLKNDYKKGFFHLISSHFLIDKNKDTKEISDFLKKYSSKRILKMRNNGIDVVNDCIDYNQIIYLAILNSSKIINDILNYHEVKEEIDGSLVKLFQISNKYFYTSILFNSLNLYVSSRLNILKEAPIYPLDKDKKELLLKMLDSIKSEIEEKSLLDDAINLINESKAFEEEVAYEILNKISFNHTRFENSLYTNFQNIANKLEKEIEKSSN